ncbi:hypothetical protein YERSI8AC_380001 [Enterobacterales bacterium 8AC]|nr:hypothetical protein YERSI8AC_380001 [Enterobacterales bacterium 8AC]
MPTIPAEGTRKKSQVFSSQKSHIKALTQMVWRDMATREVYKEPMNPD